MKTANEMRTLAEQNSVFVKWCENELTQQIAEAASKGNYSLDLEVASIKEFYFFTKPYICDTIENYVRQFGYKVNSYNAYKKIEILW
jgi:hypothetical protein